MIHELGDLECVTIQIRCMIFEKFCLTINDYI